MPLGQLPLKQGCTRRAFLAVLKGIDFSEDFSSRLEAARQSANLEKYWPEWETGSAFFLRQPTLFQAVESLPAPTDIDISGQHPSFFTLLQVKGRAPEVQKFAQGPQWLGSPRSHCRGQRLSEQDCGALVLITL